MASAKAVSTPGAAGVKEEEEEGDSNHITRLLTPSKTPPSHRREAPQLRPGPGVYARRSRHEAGLALGVRRSLPARCPAGSSEASPCQVQLSAPRGAWALREPPGAAGRSLVPLSGEGV